MQRCLWRAVGSRKQWATQRLLSTSRYVEKRSPERREILAHVLSVFEADRNGIARFRIWKHVTAKGDIPYTEHAGLSSGDKSSDPSLLADPALCKVPVIGLSCRTRLMGSQWQPAGSEKSPSHWAMTQGPKNPSPSPSPSSGMSLSWIPLR